MKVQSVCLLLSAESLRSNVTGSMLGTPDCMAVYDRFFWPLL